MTIDHTTAAQAAKQEAMLTDQRINELWIAQRQYHGGEPTRLSHLEFARAIEQELSKLRAPVADERAVLTRQDIFDKFQFLEGLVTEHRYKQIAETAITIYESGAPWASMAQTINDLRAELGYVKQYGPRVLPDMCPPATARDRWMYEQGRLAERDPRSHVATQASAPVAGEAPPRPDDREIEAIVKGLGMRWDDSRWVLEDADLHPLVRALLYRYTAAPQASEAVPRGIIDAARTAGFSFLRHADGSYTMQQTPGTTAQASEAVTLTGMDPDRLRAIASSGSLTAMSNALQNVARRLSPQDSKAVCNASNAFDDWLATHCDSDDLTAYERELARDAWRAALSAQPGAQTKENDS